MSDSQNPQKLSKQVRPAKGKTAAEALITGGAVIIALVLLNVLFGGSRTKLDLTENRIYSLSDASKKLVRNMKERVIVRAYFGNIPPEQAEKMNYVDMLLTEYAESSGGKIDYQKIDPWEKPELQEELKKDGIDKLRLQSRKDDSIQLVSMYFQIVFSHLDKKEVWTPEQTFSLEGLEYDFSSRIKRLGDGKKKVGVTQGFGETQDLRALQAAGQELAPMFMPGVKIGLGDLYDVTAANWKTDPKSIDDVDVLIVNGPTERVSDAAKLHLDQYVMKGKPVLFLVGGMKWQSAGQNQMQQMLGEQDQPYLGVPDESGLGELLATYGFEIGKDVILDGTNGARFWLPPGSRNGAPYRFFAPYAQALANGPHDILANMQVLALPFASTLKLVGPLEPGKVAAETQVVELLKTAPTSFAHEGMMAITPTLKAPVPDKSKGPYLVAAAVSGKFKSYFADRPVPADVNLGAPAPGPGAADGEPPPSGGEADPPAAAPPAPAAPAAPGAPAAPAAAGPLKESVAHTRMVVVTAPSLAATETIVSGNQAGELVFITDLVAAHDLVDWLAEDEDLVAVRSKKIERPLVKLEPGEKNLVKYANVVGAPLLLIAFGVGYWRVRERRRRHIVL